ncbi:hypothetical protein [uncultured Brevundimonas sp.]|uniref:hypothetical protein n=1 Tax=uncultured Brevundimonas sp. TaxID=213418 RepID=UPI002632A8ED|nr:hypothetical protein [uncultured Brevundimonas sp.]
MKIKHLVVALTAALTLAAPLDAKADPDIQIYRESKIDEIKNELIRLYISGVENGFKWANASAELTHGVKLYCAPPELALTEDQIVSILDRYIEKESPEDSDPLGMILMFALMDVFPCN